jgi:hypothetical protein
VTSQLINAATPISPPIPAHTGPRPRSPGRKDPAARHGRIFTMCPPKGRHNSHQPEPCPLLHARLTAWPTAHRPMAAMAALHRQMPGRARRPAPGQPPRPGSGRAGDFRRMDTLTPLPDSRAVSHAFMIHPPVRAAGEASERGDGCRSRGVRPLQGYLDLGKGMTVRMCLPSNVTGSPRSGRPLPGVGWLSMVPV